MKFLLTLLALRAAALGCSVTPLDSWANTYEFPFNHSISSELYWAKDFRCVRASDDSLFVQAAHFNADLQQWTAIVPIPPHPSFRAVCRAGQCISQLDDPGEKALIVEESVGLWIPRRRADEISDFIILLTVFFVVYLVLITSTCVSAPLLGKTFYGGAAGSSTSVGSVATFGPRAASSFDALPIMLPTYFTLIYEMIKQLCKMLGACATLLVFCFYFVMRREITSYDKHVMIAFPIVLIAVHVYVLLQNLFNQMMYYSVLASRRHLTFDSKTNCGILLTFHWLIILCSFLVWMVCASSISGRDFWNESAVCHSRFCIAKMLITDVIKLVLFFFPAMFSINLIYADDMMEKNLATIHSMFSSVPMWPLYMKVKENMADAAMEFRQDLMNSRDVPEEHFYFAGDTLYQSSRGSLVTLRGVLQAMEAVDIPVDESWWSKKKRAFSRARLTWTWRIRLSQCEDGGKELRNVLMVITTVVFVVVLFVLVALLYAKTLIPTLDLVELSVGQLVPAFSLHVQNYNIYVDKHVRGAYVTILANKDLVSYTTLQFPYLHHSDAHYQHTWVDNEHRQFVSFFVRPPSDALARASQKDTFLRSAESPLHFHISTHGANAITTYRFTVVKTEAKVVSMDYTYAVAERVDPVTVHKEINWASVLADISGGNDMGDGDDAGALAASEAEDTLSCYVPHDTTTIQLRLEKQLIVYGPTGHTIHDTDKKVHDGDNGVDWFKAQAVLHICGPNDKCDDHRGENIDVELDSRLTVVPVFLHATGGSPRPFQISVIRVSNRLVALGLIVLPPNQQEWLPLVLMPTFRPLSMSYEVYFDAAPSLPPETTFFFRVTPQGDAKINYIKARFSTPLAEAFCRPPDGALSAMERTAEADNLGCGASGATKRLAELFAPTEHLVTIVEATDMAFEKHFLVRYTVKNTQPQPWTIELDVAFKGEIVGFSSSTYVIHMLPQTPMSIGINVPIPRVPTKPVAPGAPAVLMQMSDVPLALEPAFNSRVSNYTLFVPKDVGNVQLKLRQFDSFWAGVTNLENVASGARITQEAKLERCGSGYCPIALRVYERRDGFPRTYYVQPKAAEPASAIFLGTTNPLRLLPNFRPSNFSTVVNGTPPLVLLVGGGATITASWNNARIACQPVGSNWWQITLSSVAGDMCRCQRGMPGLARCTESQSTRPMNNRTCVLQLHGDGKMLLSARFGTEEITELEEAAEVAEEQVRVGAVKTNTSSGNEEIRNALHVKAPTSFLRSIKRH